MPVFVGRNDFINPETGELLDLNNLTVRAKESIDGIEQEVTILKNRDGEEIGTRVKTKLKLVPKISAMDMFMKHLGGYEKDNKQQRDNITIFEIPDNGR